MPRGGEMAGSGTSMVAAPTSMVAAPSQSCQGSPRVPAKGAPCQRPPRQPHACRLGTSPATGILEHLGVHRHPPQHHTVTATAWWHAMASSAQQLQGLPGGMLSPSLGEASSGLPRNAPKSATPPQCTGNKGGERGGPALELPLPFSLHRDLSRGGGGLRAPHAAADKTLPRQ